MGGVDAIHAAFFYAYLRTKLRQTRFGLAWHDGKADRW